MKISRGALAVAGLAVIVLAVALLRRSEPPAPSTPEAGPKPLPRDTDVERAHEARLAENRERDRREFKPGPLADRGRRIDESPYLTDAQKLELKEQWKKDLETAARLEETNRRFAEDVQKYKAEIQAELAKEPEKKAPAKLRLLFETAGTTLLPLQPLVINLHLVNSGESREVIKTSLDAQDGYLKTWVCPSGSTTFQEVSLSPVMGRKEFPDGAGISLAAGARASYQTELPLRLGVSLKDKRLLPGAYRVRIELAVSGDVEDIVKADEVTVTVVAPTGGDATVLEQILGSQLIGFLGPNARFMPFRLWRDLPAILDQVEALFTGHPSSAYAPLLRGAFLAVALDHARELAPTEQDRPRLEARLEAVFKAASTGDRPRSWARAESLLLLSRTAERLGRLRDAAEFLGDFAAILPDDLRTPGSQQRSATLSGRND